MECDMPGHPGTVRFGDYPNWHESEKPGADGREKLRSQADGDFIEQHFLFNPAEQGRAMGTTLGDKPGDSYSHQKQQYEAAANHDGFTGGDAHLTNLDEYKVLRNTLNSVKCEYSDYEQNISNSSERTA